MRDFGCSEIVAQLGTALFALAFGTAPLLLAPLSEDPLGRFPMLLISAVLYSLAELAQALSPNVAFLLVMRFVGGSFGSTGVAVVAGSIADMWPVAADRSIAMSIFATCAFAGTGLGPVVCGFIEDRVGWRVVHVRRRVYYKSVS